jgi:hypothetical protein
MRCWRARAGRLPRSETDANSRVSVPPQLREVRQLDRVSC